MASLAREPLPLPDLAWPNPANAARMQQVCNGAAVVYNCVNPPFLPLESLPRPVRS